MTGRCCCCCAAGDVANGRSSTVPRQRASLKCGPLGPARHKGSPPPARPLPCRGPPQTQRREFSCNRGWYCSVLHPPKLASVCLGQIWLPCWRGVVQGGADELFESGGDGLIRLSKCCARESLDDAHLPPSVVGDLLHLLIRSHHVTSRISGLVSSGSKAPPRTT